MTCLTVPARLEAKQGRYWWRCPRCNALLAELDNDVLHVKVGGRSLTIAFTQALQTCGKCGARSTLDIDMVRYEADE